MGGVWFEIFVIVLLVLANGVFAMSEISVVAARKIRLQQRAEEGDARAAAALELANAPAQFLSTVQFGITLDRHPRRRVRRRDASREPLAAFIAQFPEVAPYAEGIALGHRRRRHHGAVADSGRAGAQEHRAAVSRDRSRRGWRGR